MTPKAVVLQELEEALTAAKALEQPESDFGPETRRNLAVRIGDLERALDWAQAMPEWSR